MRGDMGDAGAITQIPDPMVDAIDNADAPNGAPPFSIFDRLKARRGELMEERTFDIDVPGTGGRLVLRLGVLPRQRLAALQSRAGKANASPEEALDLNADTIISACRNVLGREQRDDPLVPLDPSAPVGIGDDRLATSIGLPERTRAREVLLGVFALAPSPDMAIAVAAGRYLEWASAAADDIDEEFAGE
jgi:hypothetical protein